MPDANYIKYPRPESINFFEMCMKSHDMVKEIKEIEKCYYLITRYNKPEIRVFVSNFYAISLDNYFEIKEEYADLDCIITISNWNSVTDIAYEQGKKNHIGLFTFDEFMGALWYAKPYTYIRPIDK